MKHIFLVDDDLNFRRSLTIQLELEGFEVSAEEGAEKALDRLKRCRDEEQLPEVVISDVRMPGMGGVQFYQKLKNMCPGLPVLFISAYKQPEVLSKHPFVKKPFKFQKIKHEIVKMLD